MKQLQAFFALMDTHNFTQAAQRVHLSQSAFSSLIANLESELGYKLFDRDTRKVQLNQNGLHFLPLARNLLSLHEHTIQEITSYRAAPHEHITLAVMPSIVAHWVPAILTSFQQQHPQIEIKLIDAQWSDCLNLLLHGKADFAITTVTPSISNLHSELLFRDAFYLACHHDHPLAQQAEVSLTEVGQHKLIGFTKGTSLRLYTDTLIEPFKIKYTLEVSQLTTMLGLLMANYGVGIITELSAFQFQHPNLILKPLANVTLDRPIYLATHQQKTLSPIAQKLHQHIRQSDHYLSLPTLSQAALDKSPRQP